MPIQRVPRTSLYSFPLDCSPQFCVWFWLFLLFHFFRIYLLKLICFSISLPLLLYLGWILILPYIYFVSSPWPSLTTYSHLFLWQQLRSFSSKSEQSQRRIAGRLPKRYTWRSSGKLLNFCQKLFITHLSACSFAHMAAKAKTANIVGFFQWRTSGTQTHTLTHAHASALRSFTQV